MPTRKQRRRRQKDRRHDYEYVYVDEEGHEVAVEEPEPAPGRRGERTNNAKGKTAKASSSRAVRKVDPPSWSRVGRRALIFAPLIFFALQILNHTYSVAGRLALTVVYTAFFIPFMYLMDRAMYRAYLRRIGQPLPPTRGRLRR
jgi:hypothetical protein